MSKHLKEMCCSVFKKVRHADTLDDNRYDQNEIEYEYRESLEGRMADCPKKSSHSQMLPVSKFSRKCLPETFNENENIYELTQCMAYLTIRLVIFKRVHKFNYLCCKRGVYTFGSGRVSHVRKISPGNCQCRNCKSNPSDTCWTILICTATHVVMNDEEAERTTCVFFDEDDQSKIVALTGCRIKWRSVGGDLCMLEIDTCNKELATNLLEMIYKFNFYWEAMKEIYGKDESVEKLVIIVSHPHGGKKRISFGNGIDIGKRERKEYSRFIYSTPTCEGSSGAPVYILGIDWFESEYVHSGSNKCESYPNYSAIWYP